MGDWSDADSEAEMAELLHLDLSTEPEGTGKNEYLAACEALGIVPVAMFIAKLDCAHINLRHHGVGVKGARALAAALKPNTHIRALNLGDNWLGDEGAAAVAAVLGVNATIASLNLAENRIGAYGVRALSDGIKRTSVLRELVLKGNGLDDRAAAPLVEAITKSNSLSRLDLSSNAFGEEMGVLLGAAIASHGYLLELNLGWNSLRGKGGTGIAEGLKSNLVLQKINLSWNGMGDSVASALGHALATNSTLIEIDASHNRFGCAGAIAIAEGLKSNHSLITCELSHNPMAVDEAMRISLDGVTAIVEALRENTSIETLGLSHVQEAAAHKRGDAPRFDPKRPDGHYRLDLSQPWDSFICETLYDRMTAESGESWMNMKLNGAALVLPRDGSQWHPPTEGVIDFDYVTWKHGMEVHSENLRKQRTARAVTLDLDLANPGDAIIADRIVARVRDAAGGNEKPEEFFRDCRLDGTPFNGDDGKYGGKLPSSSSLKFTYVCNKPQDMLEFEVNLDLSVANDRTTAKRLWERAITSPCDSWKSVALDGSVVQLSTWLYPELPQSGAISITHTIVLATRPMDRGRHFSRVMDDARFRAILKILSTEALPDADRAHLLQMAAARNYFDCSQALPMVGSFTYRKGKIDAANVLHPRIVDPDKFTSVLQALTSEDDRQAVLQAVSGSKAKR